VGGSYRQLLGTAEMIVDMRRDITVVESKLESVADGCGRGVVGKRVTGLGKLGPWRGQAGDTEDLGWTARMKVLSGCVVVVGRLLRRKEGGEEKRFNRSQRLVTAAKVLVLSRLLMKKLSDETNEDFAGVVEETKKKIGALRRRLLRGVERVLEKVNGDREDLLHALCAYSLATSSGAKDALRHFLHVRGEALALAFEDEEEHIRTRDKDGNMVKALGLYTQTLLDVQALVPRRLHDALLGLEGLRLDVYERWLGDDIIYFSSYIRHDDLDGQQAVETLRGWAKKASEILLQGFEKTSSRIPEFKAIVDLRTKVFEIWIRDGGKAKGFDSVEMLDGLRNTINSRMISLVEARISKLHLVGTEIEAALGSWVPNINEKASNIWGQELFDMELSNGARDFKAAIICQVYGRNDTVSRVVKGYEAWLHLTNELFATIDQLKKQRWDDDLENLDDDLSLEDRDMLLSKDDPAMLQKRMDRNLKREFDDLHEKISTLAATHRASDHAGGISIFLLRVLREIRTKLPTHPDLQSFGLSLVPALHKSLASSVLTGSLEGFKKTIFKKRKRLVGRALWEGSPELPVQPSPATFRLLHSLTSSMAEAGADLWSPAAIAVIKSQLCDALTQEWEVVLQKPPSEKIQPNEDEKNSEKGDDEKVAPDGTALTEETATNGDDSAKSSEPDNLATEILTQTFFDALLMRNCLLPKAAQTAAGSSLVNLTEKLQAGAGLASADAARMEKAALENWKRTSLLFGILA